MNVAFDSTAACPIVDDGLLLLGKIHIHRRSLLEKLGSPSRWIYLGSRLNYTKDIYFIFTDNQQTKWMTSVQKHSAITIILIGIGLTFASGSVADNHSGDSQAGNMDTEATPRTHRAFQRSMDQQRC